ncbi:MAG: PspC domain-containing protein [Burkholderiales bacterium]|nr:PspC domain-containing protein [Bacteroidia bacterium]
MNKTVTINICGIIFHIEEDAFDKLSKYLNTIKGYFSKADGGNEIMSDIEARIAEMLQSKTSAVKQVVLMSDVDFVIDSMGKPEEFAGDASENNNSSDRGEGYDTYENGEPTKKRLYRDGDSKVLGGVCSGIAHYFGIDPVWLRIALLLMFFFAGTGFLLYIILWIAIPEAKTTTERLAMKGEKADINNISKAVKEEAEQLKKRMEKYGSEFKDMAARNVPRNAVEKTVDFIGDLLLNIGRVLLKIVAIFMVFFGIICFLGLFGTVFGMSFAVGNLEIQEWIDMILLDGSDFYIGLFGIAFFIGIPIIMMIYFGIKLLFKIRYYNRWLNLSAGILWLIGFSMLLYVGIRTGQDFNKVAKVRETISVVPNDTLILKMNEVNINFAELHVSDDSEEGEKDFSVNRRHNNFMIGKHGGVKYLLGYARLNIIKSQTNKIELIVVKEAHGSDKQIAKTRAEHISYNVIQQDSTLLFDNIFKVNDADKYRDQDITVILKLPVGKVIYLDKSLENMIYDLENVTNTYDGDMINRRWMMTENGLKCIDCDGLISVKEHDDDDRDNYIDPNDDSNGNVRINVNGVDINAQDAQIKVDSNGVKINSRESKLTIDKNGVHVKTKNNH